MFKNHTAKVLEKNVLTQHQKSNCWIDNNIIGIVLSSLIDYYDNIKIILILNCMLIIDTWNKCILYINHYIISYKVIT